MAKSKNYNWSDLTNPPILGHHSAAKHKIIREYLNRYFDAVTQNVRIDSIKINLIDGFSGGGYYKDADDHSLIVDGSPIHLIKAVQESEKRIQAHRTKPFKIQAKYFFIEKDTNSYNALKYYLNSIEQIPHGDIQLINGSFIDTIPQVLNAIQTGGSSKPKNLFILDQYGYKDVLPQTLNNIFTLFPCNTEVILTYQTDSLINHLSETPAFKTIMERQGLTDFFDRVKSKKVSDSPESRMFIEQELHKHLAQNNGAKFFTPFFITARPSNQTYWLIHLSNHPKARNVMTDVHWHFRNSFSHYGGKGLNMMVGYDPKKDYGAQTGFEFSFNEQFELQNNLAMIEDIPQLFTKDTCISFGTLIENTCNNSPATINHYKKAVFRLHHEGDISLKTVNGRDRRKWESIENTDILTLKRQFMLL